ncbi:MAG: DUF5317 domain-containing protein [Actinobacteria bacterium]|nr:DUF5317 domain-containing protein [Actinomycetota bacterium]
MAGIAIGLIRGGRFSNLSSIKFRYPWLVFVGLAIQIAGELLAAFVNPAFREGGRGLTTLAVSYAALIAFVVLNREQPGASLIALGLALNLLVILPNGGMPVSAHAAHIAGFDPSGYLGTALKHRAMGPGTIFSWLGDVIPIPGLGKVVSVGDIVLGLGVGVLTQSIVRGTNPPREPHDAQGPAEGPR